MADSAARSRKTESWRAEAGLQPLQLSVVHVVYVPESVAHEFFKASQFPAMVDEQALLTTAVLPPLFNTHLEHVSIPEGKACEGQTLTAVPTLHEIAWAEATRTVAKMAT
jgi:hypothetical protein